MTKDIELDLHKFRLFGWEPRKRISDVEEILGSAREGVIFPRVDIMRLNSLDYSLFPLEVGDSNPDGGHRRAIAHYLADIPLKCRLHPLRISEFEGIHLVNLLEISLIKDGEKICKVKFYKEGKPHNEYTEAERSSPLPF